MSSRTWLRALFFLLFLCFGFGLLSVMLEGGNDSSSTRPTPSPGPRPTAPSSEAASEQTSAILVLGVDDLAKEQPRLLAVWLVAHDTTQDQVLLYGIPISATASDDDLRSLAASSVGLRPMVSARSSRLP